MRLDLFLGNPVAAQGVDIDLLFVRHRPRQPFPFERNVRIAATAPDYVLHVSYVATYARDKFPTTFVVWFRYYTLLG